MAKDIVRVLRIIEYVGERDLVEGTIERSIHGTKEFGTAERKVKITVSTLGEFPEILKEGT